MVSQCRSKKNYALDTKTCKKSYKFDLEVKVVLGSGTYETHRLLEIQYGKPMSKHTILHRQTDIVVSYIPLNFVHVGYNNFKDGQGLKDKYLDTSRYVLSQEMLMCIMKALIFI